MIEEVRDREPILRSWSVLAAGGLSCALCTGVIAQVDPNSGIDFVTIDHPGNAPYLTGNPNDRVNGRGEVDYTYKIGRDEVTTQQWVDFYNAAFDRPANDRLPFITIPTFWGAVSTTPNTPGGLRWAVPAGNEMRPVGNISWRTAAMLCNWLCNGRSSDRSAFLNGAYDVSTFGMIGTVFTDQTTHNPGAQYYIPSWDQLLKASFWSPSNPNHSGWYSYSNGTDSPYIYGPPGSGQANAGFSSPSPYTIPLGSYAGVSQSPWGLLDVAGGTTEWTESVLTDNVGNKYRYFAGSYWGEDAFESSLADNIGAYQAEYPYVDSHEFGFRIASAVPAPPSCVVLAGVLCILGARRSSRGRLRCSLFAVAGLAAAALCQTAAAQVDPNSGIDFVTIDHPGNAPYLTGNPNDDVNGRGGVDYTFKIGRDEVTTQQWVDFYNAAFDRPANDRLPFITIPTFWGAVSTTPNTPGGLRWTVPAGNELRPVGNISWRTAAMLCNWLCNGRSSDRSAFLNGAYDVSTFGMVGTVFTDQTTHNPGAQYYIPSWDQLLKASFWSPSNPNHSGWYNYSNGSDSPYIYGPPGSGQANAGFNSPSPYTIPLGSYAGVSQSPWGLLDVAGGTAEWSESVLTDNVGNKYRYFSGSYWGDDSFQASLVDSIHDAAQTEYPYVDSHEFGFRIASSVPAPPTCVVLAGVLCTICARSRLRENENRLRPIASDGRSCDKLWGC